MTFRARILVAVVVVFVACVVPHAEPYAEPYADSSRVSPCNARTAFALGLVVPGGGQFYLGDRAGGIQAVITDVILFEALRRNDATISGVVFFIGAVHVVEALFATRECTLRNAALRPRVTEAFPERREAPAIGLAVAFPISR